MNKYSCSALWSEEDESYIALCPEFPGLSGIGDTLEEAIAELQTALRLAIKTYQDEGWSLPEPRHQAEYSGKLLVRMPKTLHSRLAQQAEREAVSLNTLVVTHLSEAVGLTSGVARIEPAVTKMLHVWDTNVVQPMAAAGVVINEPGILTVTLTVDGEAIGAWSMPVHATEPAAE